MPIYFMLLEASWFHERMRPALSASWRQRSFEPCRALCSELLPAAHTFANKYHMGSDEPLVGKIAGGFPFDRCCWQLLVGEMLLFAAADIPDIQTAADTLYCLLDPERPGQGPVSRERLGRIRQAHHGARYLLFGGRCYRPEYAGYNDQGDVALLAGYLASLDPAGWTAADLTALPGGANLDERAEELEFARQCFSELTKLYERAGRHQQIVVCEIL